MKSGINKDVNKRKNKEIPSIPKVILKFSTGIHRSFVTNWKVPADFLNPPHINKNNTKGIVETCKDINFNFLESVDFVKDRKSVV